MGAFPYRAPAEKEPESAGSGGGFVPSARIFKTGENLPFALRKNMPASCPPFRFQYSAAAHRWAGKAEYFSCTKDFPQNAAKKTGRLPLTPTVKKSAAILSSLRTKSAAGTAACLLLSGLARIRDFGGRQRVGECSKKNRGGFFALSAAEAEKAPPPVKKRGGERNPKRISARHSESKK